MKLYIADQTCSQAAQIIVNELGLDLELVHFDVFGKSTSNEDDFAKVNPMLYVPVLIPDGDDGLPLSETIVVTSYLPRRSAPRGRADPAAWTKPPWSPATAPTSPPRPPPDRAAAPSRPHRPSPADGAAASSRRRNL